MFVYNVIMSYFFMFVYHVIMSFYKFCHIKYIYTCHIYFDLILKCIKICPYGHLS